MQAWIIGLISYSTFKSLMSLSCCLGPVPQIEFEEITIIYSVVLRVPRGDDSLERNLGWAIWLLRNTKANWPARPPSQILMHKPMRISSPGTGFYLCLCGAPLTHCPAVI